MVKAKTSLIPCSQAQNLEPSAKMVVTQTKNSQLVHKLDTEWMHMKNTSLTLITREVKAASLGLAIKIRLLTTRVKRSPM